MAANTADKIIATAEDMIRRNGYNAFSFRDIADTIGIKSSSVHYHFATKADLGAAVAKQYGERFFQHLKDNIDPQTQLPERLEVYVSLFRQALTVDRKICLCGMLGAEKAALPEVVLEQVKTFFAANLDWIRDTTQTCLADDNHSTEEAQLSSRAGTLLAALEGGMLVAQTLGDDDFFQTVAQRSIQDFLADLS